jgi:hypothetical protein
MTGAKNFKVVGPYLSVFFNSTDISQITPACQSGR